MQHLGELLAESPLIKLRPVNTTTSADSCHKCRHTGIRSSETIRDEYGLRLSSWCECELGRELAGKYEAARAAKIEADAEACEKCHTDGGFDRIYTRAGTKGFREWCDCPIGQRMKAEFDVLEEAAEKERRTAHVIDIFLGADVPERYDAANLDKCAERDPEMAKQVRAWLTQREHGQGLLLWGDVGIGKTYLAVAAMDGLIDKIEEEAAFVVMPELLDDIRASFGKRDGEGGNPVARLKTVPILVLDDISAVQNATDWVRETAFTLVNARYNAMLPTIVTSNKSPAELSALIGDRIVSRLVEMCAVIQCKGKDQRVKAKGVAPKKATP